MAVAYSCIRYSLWPLKDRNEKKNASFDRVFKHLCVRFFSFSLFASNYRCYNGSANRVRSPSNNTWTIEFNLTMIYFTVVTLFVTTLNNSKVEKIALATKAFFFFFIRYSCSFLIYFRFCCSIIIIFLMRLCFETRLNFWYK